jgi:hypothetical protein
MGPRADNDALTDVHGLFEPSGGVDVCSTRVLYHGM